MSGLRIMSDHVGSRVRRSEVSCSVLRLDEERAGDACMMMPWLRMEMTFCISEWRIGKCDWDIEHAPRR